MAAIFENFLKSCHIYFFDTLGAENLNEITLSHTVKEIEAILCFCQKFDKLKWPLFFERQEIFENGAEYFAKMPLGWKVSMKLLCLVLLRGYIQFCVLAENLNIQTGCHFRKIRNF